MTRPVLTPLDGVGIIGTDELVDSAVTSAKLATDAVTQAKVANDAIGTNELLNGAVTGAKIAADAVSSANILNGGINDVDINPATPAWVQVPLDVGWTTPGAGEIVRYTRFGNIIFVSGGVGRAGGSAQFGVLPVGFRPPVNMQFPGVSGSGGGLQVTVLTNGVCTVGLSVGDYALMSFMFRAG